LTGDDKGLSRRQAGPAGRRPFLMRPAGKAFVQSIVYTGNWMKKSVLPFRRQADCCYCATAQNQRKTSLTQGKMWFIRNLTPVEQTIFGRNGDRSMTQGACSGNMTGGFSACLSARVPASPRPSLGSSLALLLSSP
jgi:hypothetical protein